MRRCIVPMDGFFERKAIKGQKAKQPYAIAMKDSSPFGIAGIWENWKAPVSEQAGNILLRASTALIHERHRFGSSHISSIEPLDAKTSILDQFVDRAVQVTATGQMLPGWGEK
jgi:SOS response associated peptidase (SRAP)